MTLQKQPSFIASVTKTVEATPTISTSAYAAGDLVGDKITLSGAARVTGATGIIQSIVIVDDADQGAEIDVVFFDTDPSNTTFTDNSAFDAADDDLENCIGVVTVAASDYASFNDNAVGTAANVGLAFEVSGSNAIYAALVTRGTPTYAATDDVTLRVTVLQD